MELLEELTHFYQDRLTKEEQISVVYETLAHILKVIEELIPSPSSSAFTQDVLINPLSNHNMKHSLPE